VAQSCVEAALLPDAVAPRLRMDAAASSDATPDGGLLDFEPVDAPLDGKVPTPDMALADVAVTDGPAPDAAVVAPDVGALDAAFADGPESDGPSADMGPIDGAPEADTGDVPAEDARPVDSTPLDAAAEMMVPDAAPPS